MANLDSKCQHSFAYEGCLKCDLVLRFSTPVSFMLWGIPAWPEYLRVGSVNILSNNLAIEYKLIRQLKKTMNGVCVRGQTLKAPGDE